LDETIEPRAPEPAEPPAADAPTPDPDPGGSDAPTPGPDVGARRAPYPGRPLRRSRDNRVVAGACGALARYTDVDPVVYRVTLAVLSIFGGVGLLLYVIGWLLIPAEGAAGSVLDRAVHRRTGSRPSVPALVGIGLAVVILAGIVSNNGSAVLALVLTLLAHRALRPLVASPSDGDWDPSNQTAAGGTSRTAGSSERYAAGGAYAPYGGSACAPYGGSASAPYGGVPVASPWPDWPGGTAVEARPRPPRSVLGPVTVSVCLLVVGALLVVAEPDRAAGHGRSVAGHRAGSGRPGVAGRGALRALPRPDAARCSIGGGHPGDLGGVDAGGCRPGGPTLAAGEYHRAATHVPARGWGRHSGPVSAQRR
jgi:phage shock protein PspC (stress-responsive transcriptional regulator)